MRYEKSIVHYLLKKNACIILETCNQSLTNVLVLFVFPADFRFNKR